MANRLTAVVDVQGIAGAPERFQHGNAWRIPDDRFRDTQRSATAAAALPIEALHNTDAAVLQSPATGRAGLAPCSPLKPTSRKP